jgi:dTDP-4-amino-4,6-dideoxygalactose transaminase
MIKYLELKKITERHAGEINDAVRRVVDSGWYLQGDANAAFETDYSHYIGTAHCIGCANGLDALTLILRAYIELGVMNEGDEVIVPANTYIATILAITANRLVPVLVEPRIETFQIDDSLIERALTDRTRAVMIVHLYGKCAYTDAIGDICRRHNLKLIEDNAQAHGCTFGGTDVSGWCERKVVGCGNEVQDSPRRTGSLGSAAAHSFYPGKNLGALGDGGAVTTDDSELAEMVRTLANYGSSRKYIFPYEGRNSRLDEIQAAVLDVKLAYLDIDNECRRRLAALYIDNVRNPFITIPTEDYCSDNVFHIFPVLCNRRDELRKYLYDNGVQTVIHYPVPPHKQDCYRQMADLSLPITERIHSEELSIPCNQVLTENEINTVIGLLNSFGS